MTDHLDEVATRQTMQAWSDAPTEDRESYTCSCGRAWEGHPNPHAITCVDHWRPRAERAEAQLDRVREDLLRDCAEELADVERDIQRRVTRLNARADAPLNADGRRRPPMPADHVNKLRDRAYQAVEELVKLESERDVLAANLSETVNALSDLTEKYRGGMTWDEWRETDRLWSKRYRSLAAKLELISDACEHYEYEDGVNHPLIAEVRRILKGEETTDGE